MNSRAKQPASIRWPFRILASLIVGASALAVGGSVMAGWSHETSMQKWPFFAALPGIAWLTRPAWHAAVHGRPPATAHWPFASEDVLAWYGITLFFVSRA